MIFVASFIFVGPPAQAACAKISNFLPTAVQKIATIEKQSGTTDAEVIAKLRVKTDGTPEQIAAAKKKIRDDMEKEINNWQAQVENNYQQDAVNIFKTTVENAMDLREQQVDQATNTFWTAASPIMIQRHTIIANAQKSFNNSITPGISTRCWLAGQVNDLFRQVKTSGGSFRVSVQGVPKLTKQISDLTLIRKKATDAANNNFKATVDQARKVVQSFFPYQYPYPTPYQYQYEYQYEYQTPVYPYPTPTGTACEQMVFEIYWEQLFRAPDPDGFASWVGACENGMTQDQMVAAFMQTDEWKSKH